MIHTISPRFTVNSYPESNKAFEQAGEALQTMVTHYGAQPLLFLSSGGSSMALLNFIQKEQLGPYLTISVTDDRYSHDPNINNFAQIMAMPFYEHARNQGCKFIDTRPMDNESLQSTGQRFDGAIKDWVTHNPEGKIVITQGVGPDRHTCGVMPYPENPHFFEQKFRNSDIWAVGYDAGEKNEYPERITLTIPFLERVEESIVYMVGEKKKKALDAILAPKGDLAATPARILRQMNCVKLFTDIQIKHFGESIPEG